MSMRRVFDLVKSFKEGRESVNEFPSHLLPTPILNVYALCILPHEQKKMRKSICEDLFSGFRAKAEISESSVTRNETLKLEYDFETPEQNQH